MKKLLTIAFLYLFCAASITAQSYQYDTLGLKIFFRENASEVDPSFRDNAKRLADFKEQLTSLLSDTTAIINHIGITTAASPDGDTDHNERLSAARGSELTDFLAKYLTRDRHLFRMYSLGEDWEGLENAVKKLNVPWKKQALGIIRNTSLKIVKNGKVIDGRKEQLKKINKREAWNYLVSNVFPDLRASGGSVHCVIQRPIIQMDTVYVDKPEDLLQRDTVYISEFIRDTIYVNAADSTYGSRLSNKEDNRLTPKDTVYLTVTEVVKQIDTVYVTVKEVVKDTVLVGARAERAARKGLTEEQIARRFFLGDWTNKKPDFAVRTNALAIPLANIGVEVPINRNWSVAADIYYPWIFRGKNIKTCNQLLAFGAEGRYWFSDDVYTENSRLLGHSVGVYAAGGYYDFERNWAGHQGEFLNVGVDYLYALPLLRGRLRLEFELGLGYIYSSAKPYFCIENKLFEQTNIRRKIHWVGPTRAQVSVVYPIYINPRWKTKEPWLQVWHKMTDWMKPKKRGTDK